MMNSTPYTDIYSDHQIIVMEYRKGSTGSIVIAPPQAGHTGPGIVDYGEGRSLAACALRSAPEEIGVYVINFKGANYLRRNETYDDMAEQVIRASVKAKGRSGGKVHLVGLCQGGVLATAVVAAAPSLYSKLTIAGAPIDSEACESDITGAINMPLSKYKAMVKYGFEPFKSGLMSGKDMLMCWKSMNAKSHYWDRYVKIANGDRSGEKLYEWYDDVQDIAGPAYLHMIENIFQKNLLIKNEMVLFGKKVNLKNINIPVNMVAGKKDTITPMEQTYSLAEQITPRSDHRFYLVEGGHLAVFNGKHGIKTVWPVVFS